MKSKKAFSLIEAMVILLLISVAVMALIPLISQKSSIARWMPIKDANGNITALNYGNNPSERVGIGDGANPYDTNAGAKLAVKTLAVNTGNNLNSILWSDNYDGNEFTKTKNHTNSIILGVNATADSPTVDSNSKIIIKSQDSPPTSTNNKIEIGNNIVVYSSGKLVIKSGINEIITVGGNNLGDFTFKAPNGAKTIMKYTGGSSNVLKIGDGSGTLKIKDDGRGVITTTGGLISANSDKRLKNIISSYKKSQNELDKINTYKFTYKSDKEKRLHTGVIAQKLVGIFDEALHVDNKGYYTVEKEPMLYAMVNSAKDFVSDYNKILKQQKQSNKKADKLLRKYQ